MRIYILRSHRSQRYILNKVIKVISASSIYLIVLFKFKESYSLVFQNRVVDWRALKHKRERQTTRTLEVKTYLLKSLHLYLLSNSLEHLMKGTQSKN